MADGILVVEDDPAVAAVVQRILQRLGAGVEIAAKGLEAVARLSAGEIGLVVLDLDLSDIDGDEVCRRVRAQGFAGRILVVSARYGPDVAAEALAAGADGFMSKPFAIIELESRVRTLLA